MNTNTLIIALFLTTACGAKMTSSDDDIDDTAHPQAIDSGDIIAPPEDTSGPPPVPVDISEDHPRLFFSPPDLPRLQGQIYDYDRVELVNRWDGFVSDRRDIATLPLAEGVAAPTTDEAWSALAAPLPNLAIYALLTGDEEVQSQSLEWMRRVAALETWGMGDIPAISQGTADTLQAFITAFDMLHTRIEPAERNIFRGKIISNASALQAALSNPATPDWAKQWSGRDGQVAHAALLMAGLTLEHEHDRAPQWIDTAERFVDTSLAGLARIQDGSWPEGPSLGSEALSSLYQSIFLLDRHYGLALADNPWLAARSEAMLRSARPGQLALLTVGDGDSSWAVGPVHQACFVDGFTDTHLASWMSEQHILISDGYSRDNTLWLEFLWCDPDVTPAVPTADTPKTHHFAQGGTMTWHDGFSADQSSMVMRAGVPIGQDTWAAVAAGTEDTQNLDLRRLHPDAGSFGWYPNGVPILVTGHTQSPKRTQVENTYTFGTTSPISRGWSATDREHWWPSASFHTDVGDLSQVGQLGEWDLDYGPPNALADAEARFEFSRTKRGITVIGASFEKMYPSGFSTDTGGQPLGLQRLARYWVILDQGIVLVFDHLRHSTDLSHYSRFRAANGGFSVSGTAGTVYGEDGSSFVVDAISGGTVYADQLVSDVLDPASTWVNQLVVVNTASTGAHHHLTVLRSTAQSVVLTSWAPTEQGVVAELVVTDEGVATPVSIRFASGAEASSRQAFLGFAGSMGITQNTDTEIRF